MHKPLQPNFLALWSINAALDAGRLRSQLDDFAAAGLDGVVFHPRRYPGTPPYLGKQYLAEVSAAILHARSLGLAFWIYDEDGWPSGAVSGQLLVRYPHLAQRRLELVAARPQQALARYDVDGTRWWLVERTGPGVDYLNPELAERFIEMTYETYRTGLAAAAFDYVSGFFDDEPEFGLGHAQAELPSTGALPWSAGVAQEFTARCGVSFLDAVPSLFFDDERSAELRIAFSETLTDLFGYGYLGQLSRWCAQAGKEFTAHVKGEEHPLFQSFTVGSVSQVMQRVGLPGIDALERLPSNNFFPRQVSSVGRQFGSGRCMAEAFGGAGWGATPADFENYLIWLGENGVTDFVLHLSQYRLDSAAINDWPPSHPLHVTWAQLYADVLRTVRARLSAAPRPTADTLLVAPQRAVAGAASPWEFVAMNVHTARTYAATGAGQINKSFMALVRTLDESAIKYDVTDERTFDSHARIVDDVLTLGAASYRHLVVHADASLSDAGNVVARAVAPPELAASRPPAPLPSAEHRAVAVTWTLETSVQNRFKLATTRDGSWVTSSVAVADLSADLVVEFADVVTRVRVDGRDAELRRTSEGSRADIVARRELSRLDLSFQPVDDESPTHAWLRGAFGVHSTSGYASHGAELVRTAGPFVLRPAQSLADHDLIAAGYPFGIEPMCAHADISTATPASAIGLPGLSADAVRMQVGGHDSGWLWQPAQWRRIAASLPAGEHTLRLTVIPSGYNYFGPHHYYLGDAPAISPGQMRGERNFADPPDAPEHTHVAEWYFRKFALPEAVLVYPAVAATPSPIDGIRVRV